MWNLEAGSTVLQTYLLDVGVEVVVPPLPALLPDPALEVLRYQGPPVAKN